MDLSELIHAARGDRSFRDLERLSAQTPKPLSYGRWQQMASGRPALRGCVMYSPCSGAVRRSALV